MASPTPRKVSISNIKSKLLRPALTSHYICRFSPTTKNGKLISFLKQREGEGFTGADYQNVINQEILEFSCSEASLPGVNYLTNEINDDFHGVTERYAYRRSYDDRMDFTFYVDRDYRPINFFESWMAFIAGEKSRKAPVDRTYFYRVEFPDNYTTDELYITKFERDIGTQNEGPTLTYRFINAYPININTMPVSYESSQLLKCTVSFTFSRYLIEKTAGAPSSQQPAQTSAPGVPSIGNPNVPQSVPPVPGFTNPEFGSASGIPSFGGSPLAPPSTAPGVPSTLLGQPTGSGTQRSTAGSTDLPKVSNQAAPPPPQINKNAGSGAVLNGNDSASNLNGASSTNARPGGAAANARPGGTQ